MCSAAAPGGSKADSPRRNHSIWAAEPKKPSTPCVAEIVTITPLASRGPSHATSVDRFSPAGPFLSRTKLLNSAPAARAAGAELSSFVLDKKGPAGENLSTDVAWLGPRDAKGVMVTISATHGVEAVSYTHL